MKKVLTRRGLLKAGGLMAAASAVAGPTALMAQEPVAMPVPDNEPAWLRAGKWAKEHDGIAIAITLGSDAGLDPDQLKENFENGFQENFGINANAFVETNDRPGSVIAYFYGPYSTKAEPFQTGATITRIEQVAGAFQIHQNASLETELPSQNQG